VTSFVFGHILELGRWGSPDHEEAVEDVLVGQIFFEGDAPFELVTERDPIAIADEGFVIVNLAVFAGGYQNATADVQIKMTMEHAAALALQLAPALAVAKEQAERL
jgi:hypothetical protein